MADPVCSDSVLQFKTAAIGHRGDVEKLLKALSLGGNYRFRAG